MTKKKHLPYNHNGKRPPVSEQTAPGLRQASRSISSRHRAATKGHHPKSTITLVFISSLLICYCCCCCCLLSAVRLAASQSATAAPRQRQQVHDSISDSSSSQAAVSNLSMRSQQQQQQPSRHRQTGRASEDKTELGRLLVERDLVASASADKQNGPAALDSSDSEPANNNNNNEPVAGEGPLNGASDENAESGGDESTIDYENSDAPAESSPQSPAESSAQDSHARPSRQSVATATTTTTTTTTTRKPAETTTTTSDKNELRGRPMQFVSNSRGGISLQQQQQQQPSAATEPTTFNVNMGSDRLLIKPNIQQPMSATATSTPRRNLSTMTTVQPARRDQEPRTSESVNHEFITTTRNPHRAASTQTNTNERRQDLLLYPTNNNYNNNNNGYGNADRHTTFMPRMSGLSSQDQDHFIASEQQPSICYTPVALVLVVLMTMTTTLVVCFCTHFLFKHYARRNQFDLVASSRQFDTKHAGLGSAVAPDHWPTTTATIGQQLQPQATSKQNNSNYNDNNDLFSGLFTDRNHRIGRSNRRDDEFAFDNPYFRDEQLRQQQQQQQQQHQQLQHRQPQQQQQVAECITAIETPHGGSEQMHFIQHHISNLHTRQVTSSVKELSVLSGANSLSNNNQVTQRDHAGVGDFQVVDLTSQEQRNKIIADAKEGDLIAVDITGHDFIGLGFDICGSQHEGIFIRSLLSRGPAKESGCIEVGDRIKCLNISFDNITLQDARDILNCGSPYKMRVLLEKRAAALVSAGPLISKTKRSHKNSAQSLLDNFARQEAANKQQPIRACLRKLGDFVSRAPSIGYENQQQLTRASLSEQQLAFEQQQVGAGYDWLGSAAARQQRALVSPFAPGNLNLAFGGSENELGQQQQQQQHKRGDTIDSACSVNLPSGRVSSIDSGAGGQEMLFNGRLRNSSSQQPLSERADSSLEHFHARNANHRLHGPGSGKNRNNLHLAMDGDTTTDDADSDHQQDSNIDRRRRRRSDDLGGHDLELTQSQPEIAPLATSNLEQQQRFLESNIQKSAAGRFDIDDDDDDGDCDDEDDGDRDGDDQRQHPKTTMLGSISTPTMNLLPLNCSAGLERRMSSRRRHPRNHKEDINEEPAKVATNPSDGSHQAETTTTKLTD